jgi:CheY-like chemotaxis protein/tRNA A-37 threonylcarbamoyl transferase component Bud32
LARILHVDDDDFWRQLIKTRLVDHHVDSAESLQRAIDLLQSESPYDVALVDLNLAGDNDLQGGDLLDLMRIRYPSTRRILVTGSPPAGSVKKIYERYDVVEIIIKRDMSLPDLRRVVEEAVAQAPSRVSESLGPSLSYLKQRFRDWQTVQAERLKIDIRVAEEHVHEEEKVSVPGRQLAELALTAAKQRETDFRLTSGRLGRLIEDIENEDQLAAAQEALDAAEEYFTQDQGKPRKARTLSGTPKASPPSDSEVLPEPDPAELRSSADAWSQDYAAGDVIDNRFEILNVLGQGGFSKVYRVQDHVEGEERALKLFDSAAGYAAVRREIGALRKIHHANVVEVFWAGKTKTGDWYLITEFVEGESLDEFVTGKRRLRDREALDVALDLLDALVAFHPDSVRLNQLAAKGRETDLSEAELHEWAELKDKGLVHRDIKPLNVILARTGAKLLDFNIASRIGDPVHTKSGTPPYQPPDTNLGRWDVSTDLFAVGVLLYQLLCDGHHPFPNAMPAFDQSVIDPRTIRPDIHPDIAEFLIKACASVTADRYSTAAEMQLALRDIRAGL